MTTTSKNSHPQLRGTVLERCPRCHGAMIMEVDAEGEEILNCLNCGNIRYVKTPEFRWNKQRNKWMVKYSD